MVITDGMTSYALYTYQCGLMEWSGFATVGFNLNGDLYENHPLTGLPSANAIACLNQSRWYNQIYQLTLFTDELQQQRADCRRKYFEDIEHFGNISNITSNLEPCPCSVQQAWLDQRFQYDLFSTEQCFYQRFPSVDLASQYCCYSTA